MEIPTDLASGFQDPKPVTPPPLTPIPAVPTPQVDRSEQLATLALLDAQKQIQEQRRVQQERFQQAVAGDPDMEARKVQIAQQLGIDPADTTQDWKIAEQFARQREVENQAFDEKYPLVAQRMRDFNFVAQAYDDIGHLQQIEKIGNFTKGRYMVERGYIGAQLASGIGDARLLRDRLAQIDSSINAVPPLEGVWDSITGGTAEMLGQMSKTMPAAVAAGAAMAAPGLVAGPAAPISSGTLFTAGFLGAQGAQTAIIEGGNAYLDYIQAGMGEAEAKQAASVVGIVNGALETVLGKYALKPFTAAAAKVGPRLAPKVFKPIGKGTVAAGFAKSYFAGLRGEIATEIGQEISQIVGEEWGMSVSRPELEQRYSTPEGRQQIYDQIGEIASKTFYSMLVLGLPGPLANMAADARRVEQAQTDTAIIKAIATGAQDSKLAERNPELARQFSAEAKGVEEVFITADALRSLLNGIDEQATADGKVQKSAIDMLRELLPDVVRQLEDATTDKDSIVIKTEDLQVSLRNTEMQSKMLPHLRIDKNGMSEAEAQKYEPNLKAMAQSAKQAISEKAQKDQQFREQLRAIRENQTAQIQAAGRSLSEASIGGHLYAQVMALMNAEVNAKLAAQGKEPIALADFERVYGMSTRAGVPMSENAIEASRVLGKFEVKPVVQTPQEAAQAAPPTAPAQPAEAAVAPAPEAAVPPSQEAAPQAQPQQAPADPVAQAKELLASPPQEMTEQERGVLETFVAESETAQAAQTTEGDISLPTPQEVGKMVEESVQLEQQQEAAPMAQKPLPSVPEVAPVKPGRAKKQVEQQLQAVLAPENITQLKDGARALAAGKITREQWDALVNKLGKVRLAQAVPALSTPEQMTDALKSSQRDRVIAPTDIPEGQYVGLRLDIPAKQRKNVDVVTIHKAGKGATAGQVIGFTNAAVVTDVEFAAREQLVFRIAQELENKDIAAIVKGKMKPMTAEEAHALAEQAMTDPQWRQVGFNPKLHSYFFDRATGEPLQSAEMVVQIGSMVLAKNAVVAPKSKFLFSRLPTPAAKLDAEYLAAVARGDMETAQRMVDEAAKASGYIYTAFHGSKIANIVVFQPRDEKNGIYFSSSPVVAGTYLGAKKTGRVYKAHLAFKSPLIVDARGGNWTDLRKAVALTENGTPSFTVEQLFGYANSFTDKLAAAVRKSGFDGIIIRNVVDVGGGAKKSETIASDVYIALQPSQIKSADPVTRDASGNVIPLSQRFDLTKDSILFSRLPTTAAITESNVEQIVADNLEGVPRKGEWRDVSNAIDPKTHGHCYVAAEAAYFLLGGKEAGWQPKYLNNASWPDGLDAGQTHHFLQHKETGRVIDPTRAQFGNVVIPYDQGKPQAWVTNKKKATESPSKRAQIVIDNVAKSFGSALRSQQPEGEVGGTYDRMARQTVLNQNAKPTTYFHELMHFMFDSYATLIQQGLASDQMRKDMDTLTRDLGKLEGGFDEYAQLSPERQAQVHEAVAYSWEAWLFSGEVPREDMRPIFSRITEFFVSTWKTLTAINETYKIESGGKDLPGMTPEVKEVFKRMVAARDQIRMAEATKAAVPLFLSKEQWVQYGGNADDWENYQQIERLRIEEAVASLGRKSLRSLGWLTRNHHDRLNAIRKIAENIRAGMYEEVQQEVERTRVERVRRFLATGEMMAEDGSISAEKAKNHKLSIDSVALDREKATAIMQPLDDAVAAAEAEQKLWEDMLLQELPLEPVKPAKPKPLPPAGTTERAVYNEAVEEHRKAMVAYAKEKSRIKSWNQKIRENRETSSKAVTEAKRNQRGGLEQIAAMKKKARDAHPLASMLAEDGVSPHFLRDMFGYESAEAVLEDLLKAPSKEDAIMASIDAKMLAENSELSNPQQVEEAVNASLVNQFNTKWLVMELSALERATLGGQNTPAQMQEQQEAEREVIDLKNDLSVAEQTLRAAKESKDQSAIERAQESVNDLRAAIRDRQKVAEGKLPPRIMLAAARAAARMATQDKKISELRPDLHVGAARRHSREALQHLTDNDLPAALNSKRQQLLSDQMAREAEDVRAEVQSSRRWFARILKNKNRKDRSLDYVVAARAVLALFGVGSKAQVRRAAETAQQFLQQLQQYEPERFAEINRIIVEATANRKDFRDLTVEEFRRLKALVSELWQYAKDEKSVLLDGTRQQVEAIKTQIQERASKLAKPGARPGQLRKMTPLEGGIAWLRSRIAWMRRAESMFDEWDGKEPGIFTKTFWRPVQKAVLAYRSKRDQYHKRFNDILDKVRPSMKWEPIHSKELNYTFSDTAELMGFLMHLGNESNAAKHIAAGRGAGHQWGTVNEATGAVDETRVWKAINDLIAEGKLTQEHVDAVQEVWNLTADLKPQIQKVYRQKWGEFFHEVPARSFTLTFNDGTTKTYAGGYVPAKVDNDLVADYGDPSSLASVDQEFKDSMPTTGWGFTIKRYEEYRKPLDMDLSRIAQHIEHTMRFVEIQPQLWALSRLLKNEEIKTAINSIDPDALKQVIFPWLSRVASQRTGVRGGDSATDRLLRLTRNRAGMMVMFGNISNTLQQITGVFPALLKVKKSYLFASARRFLSSKKGEFAAWVASKSVFMDQRLRSQIFVLQEHMNDILVNPSKLDKARQFATKNAYIFQATVQNRLDVIIWSAAYEQAMAEKPSGTSELDWEKEAVARADAAVNLTQGSTQPEAISAAESGTEFVRLFTQFTSYFNMLFNLNMAEVKKLTQDGGWSSNKWPLFYTFMMGYAVPSVTAAIIAQAIGGKLDDEDDDGYMDEAGIIMLKGLVSGGLSMVPIAGQSIAALTINRFDEVTYNDRMLSNPAIGAIEKAFGGGYQLLDAAVSEDKDATWRKVRDALILFDMIAGIPVSQTFNKLAMGVNVMTGEQPTYGVVDAARAIMTGSPAEGLRQR